MQRNDVSVRLNLPERSRQINPLMETSETRTAAAVFPFLLFPAVTIYSAQDHVCSAPISRGAFAVARLSITSHGGARRLPSQRLFQRVLFKPRINPLEYSTGNDAAPLT